MFPYVASSQQALISGRILQKNKKPLSAANIFISGSYDGASSDSLGFFHFSSALKGPQTLLISAVGLQPQKASIDLKDSIYLTIILQTDQQAIEEVLIRAGQFKVGQQANAALSPLDIVTTAGSMGNIIAALEKLPGAQIAGENGRLMVRGGDPWETQTYINGFRVAQPYTASANGVPVRGCFSPFLFKGTNFSTGGYSAEFGNALSSILNLSTDVKLAEPNTDLSFSSIGLGLSNSQTWKNSSLSINGTYSNLGPYLKIIPQDIVWEKPYQQTNAEAIYRTKSDKHFFNLYAAYSDERFAFEDYAIAYDQSVKTSIHENNIYLNSNISYYLPAGWKFDLGGSTRFTFKVGQQLKLISIEEIESFYAANKGTYCYGKSGENYLIDYMLDQLEKQLDPELFFRINRGYIVQHRGIKSIAIHSNSRLRIIFNHNPASDAIVSRERVQAFKSWLA